MRKLLYSTGSLILGIIGSALFLVGAGIVVSEALKPHCLEGLYGNCPPTINMVDSFLFLLLSIGPMVVGALIVNPLARGLWKKGRIEPGTLSKTANDRASDQ